MTQRVFAETGPAKAITARPQGAEMLALLETSKESLPECVIATSLERLSRTPEGTTVLANALKRADAGLYVRDRGEIDLNGLLNVAPE